METVHDGIHHVTAYALLILEEGLVVKDSYVPPMMELEEAHMVLEAEVQACAASTDHSLEDTFQADWHQRSHVHVAALAVCIINMHRLQN